MNAVSLSAGKRVALYHRRNVCLSSGRPLFLSNTAGKRVRTNPRYELQQHLSVTRLAVLAAKYFNGRKYGLTAVGARASRRCGPVAEGVRV